MKKYFRIKEERNSIIKILENLTFEEKKQVLRKTADTPPISINFYIFNLMSVLIMIKYQTFLIRS